MDSVQIPLVSPALNCLICGFKTTSHETKTSSISRHLYVVFILRNILEVPREKLVIYLKTNPNLEDWLSICENCNKLINNCRVKHGEILEATKNFNNVKKKVIQVLKHSSTFVKQEKIDLEEMENPNKVVPKFYNIDEEIRGFVMKSDYPENVDPFILGDQAARSIETKIKIIDHKDTIDSRDDDEWIEYSPSSLSPNNYQGNKSHMHSCPKCGSVIPTKRLLNGHILKCTGESLPCPYANCSRKFHNEKALSIHVAGVHKSKEDRIDKNTLRCPKCDKIYSTNKRLKIHYRNVHERSIEFRRKWSGAKKPRKKKVDVKQMQKFICESCGTKFMTNRNLERHRLFNLDCKILRNEGTVNCGKCGKQFASEVALKSHDLTVHENKHSVFCEICGKGCNGKKELEVHLWRSHKIGDRKKWTCTVDGCEIMVYSKRMLEDHLKMKHGNGKDEPGYKCGECGKGFWLNKYLDQHVRVVHKMKKSEMERKNSVERN